MILRFLIFMLVLICAGCGIAPLKGGRATVTKSAAGVEQTVVQSENPAAVSRQDQETVKVKTYTVPAGSRLVEERTLANGQGERVTNVTATVLSAAMPVVGKRHP